MSSKRATRKKRKGSYTPESPNKPKPVVEKKEGPEKIKLPGGMLVKTGSVFLLISALMSALTVWYAVRSLNQLSSQELIDLTAAYHQTPLSYVIGLVLTSIAAVFQMIFGYQIFRKSNDPFYWKPSMIMAGIMAVIEFSINIVTTILSKDNFNLMLALYGTVFPLVIIWGSYKNRQFALDHPGYVPPEPIKMF